MSTWNDLSNELSQAIQVVGKSMVTVQAGGGRTASGIVADEKTVLTTARAVADEEKTRLWISPDQRFDASLVGIDSGTDIAVLKTGAKLAPGRGIRRNNATCRRPVAFVRHCVRGTFCLISGLRARLQDSRLRLRR